MGPLQIDHYFFLPGEKFVVVQSQHGRKLAKSFIHQIRRRYRPSHLFFNFQNGGHVAACQGHVGSTFFAKIDLFRFYNQISRSRITRNLRDVGFSQFNAFEIADSSTHPKAALPPRSRGMPFGICQASLLAALALEKSAAWKKISEFYSNNLQVSIYGDDILCSSHDKSEVEEAYNKITKALEQSGFQIHPVKSGIFNFSVSVFNLVISGNQMNIEYNRMQTLRENWRIGNTFQKQGIEAYVRSVNPTQLRDLYY